MSEEAKIMADIARATWAKNNPGKECPLDRIPQDERTVIEWVTTTKKQPEAAMMEYSRRLTDLYGGTVSRAPCDGRVELYDAGFHALYLATLVALDAPTDPAPVESSAAVPEVWYNMERITRIVLLMGEPPPPSGTLLDIYGTVCATPGAKHPHAPLIEAWQRFALPIRDHETRTDKRIMPVLKVAGPSPERGRGMRFGGLVDDRPSTAELSLFPELEPTRHRVPLLEIVDRSGVPIRSQGKGAPREARLLVRGGLLMIRPKDRHLATVRIEVSVGELLDGLWPPRRDKRGKLDRKVRSRWRKLRDALYQTRDWTVPDAGGGRWFPMALRRLPPNADGTPALDALVTIDLAPPPGAVTGASVDLPWLDRMGVSSGPKWRAYIAGRSLIWLPGTTRRPVPKTKPRRYGWSRNLEDYPVLTLDDFRRLAFGNGDEKNRTRAEIVAPWQNLPDLKLMHATDKRTGVHGWRLLPNDRR